MNWGFLAICCLAFSGMVTELTKHGEAKTGRYNCWITSATTSIHMALILWAMHWRIN